MLTLNYAKSRIPTKLFTVDNGIILSFAFWSLLGMFQHEMWRDELQAWLLARDSSSPINLVSNMGYEGHPALWHLCLYALNQITHDPIIMQFFHLVIAIGVVTLIVKASPFSRPHRFLLTLSYFFFFEYNVICRSYALGVFFLMLFCTVYNRSKHRPNYIFLATILVLAANTNLYAFMVTVSLSLFLVLDRFVLHYRPLPQRLTMISSVGILGAGWLVSAWQIIRIKLPKESGSLATSITSQNSIESTLNPVVNDLPTFTALEIVQRLTSSINDVWSSYFPIPPLFEIHFWNFNILARNSAIPTLFGISMGGLLASALSLLLIGLSAYLLRRNPAVFWTFLFGNLMLLLFRSFVHNAPYARYYGHFFILFLLCFWLLLAAADISTDTANPTKLTDLGKRHNSLVSSLLTVIFLGQAFAGVYAMSIDYLLPFSSSKAAATFIKSNQLDELPIVGMRDRQASVVSGYLNSPIYYPQRQEYGTFWTKQTPAITGEQFMRSIEAKLADPQHDRLLLVLTEPLDARFTSRQVEIVELAKFDQAVVGNELFYLYLAASP